jgi:hypothetical protein
MKNGVCTIKKPGDARKSRPEQKSPWFSSPGSPTARPQRAALLRKVRPNFQRRPLFDVLPNNLIDQTRVAQTHSLILPPFVEKLRRLVPEPLMSTPAWRTCTVLAFFEIILKMMVDDAQSISEQKVLVNIAALLRQQRTAFAVSLFSGEAVRKDRW